MKRKLSSKEVEGYCLLAMLFCTGPVQKAAEKKWLKLDTAKPKSTADRLAKLERACELAKDELHEMSLAQKVGIPPRNPDLTTTAIKAVAEALAACEEGKNG